MKENLVGEIIKERSKEIYEDGFKGATTEAGQALEAVVGLFNNVVLYPIKKANLSFKYKLEEFEKNEEFAEISMLKNFNFGWWRDPPYKNDDLTHRVQLSYGFENQILH